MKKHHVVGIALLALIVGVIIASPLDDLAAIAGASWIVNKSKGQQP